MEPSQAARARLPAGSLLGVVPPTRMRFYTGLRAGQVSRMPQSPAVRIQSGGGDEQYLALEDCY